MNRPRAKSGNAQTSCKRKVDPDFGMQAIKMREGSSASQRAVAISFCSPSEVRLLANSVPFCRKATAGSTPSQQEGVYNGPTQREEITPSGAVRRIFLRDG
jgi:hypothetical protein